jgi:hypothetical protein
MTVHHGDYLNTETATGDTIEAALAKVLETPMGRGYGITTDNRYYRGFVEQLRATGQAEHGWARYSAEEQLPVLACDCGQPASWHGDRAGHRFYACDECAKWQQA